MKHQENPYNGITLFAFGFVLVSLAFYAYLSLMIQ